MIYETVSTFEQKFENSKTLMVFFFKTKINIWNGFHGVLVTLTDIDDEKNCKTNMNDFLLQKTNYGDERISEHMI
jgi:hypothetical protein